MRIVASCIAVVVFTTSAQRCYSTRTKSHFVPQVHFRDGAEWWEDCSCGHFCSLCWAAATLHFCAYHYSWITRLDKNGEYANFIHWTTWQLRNGCRRRAVGIGPMATIGPRLIGVLRQKEQQQQPHIKTKSTSARWAKYRLPESHVLIETKELTKLLNVRLKRSTFEYHVTLANSINMGTSREELWYSWLGGCLQVLSSNIICAL